MSVPRGTARAVHSGDSGGLEHARIRRAAVNRATRYLVAADCIGFAVAYLLAGVAAGPRPLTDLGRWEAVGLAGALLVWVSVAALHGLYRYAGRKASFSRIACFIFVAWWVLLAASVLAGEAPTPTFFVLASLFAIPAVVGARAAARIVGRARGVLAQRTVILGAGNVGQMVAEKIQRHPEWGLHLLGFLDSNPRPRHGALAGVPVLGDPVDAPSILSDHAVSRVIVAFSATNPQDLVQFVRSLAAYPVQIDVVPQLFEAVGPSAEFDTIEGLPTLTFTPAQPSRISALGKRVFDVIGAGLGLLVLSPVFAFIAIRIRLDSTGPAIYRSSRIGRYGEPFTIYKFRTMHANSEALDEREHFAELLNQDPSLEEEFQSVFKLRDDPRVTNFGRFLRRTSLDELPQLVNIVKGDMSIVGPRPLPYDGEIDLYGGDAERLLSVPPGLTGLWQTNGRSDVSYDERIRLDMAYVQARSPGLDLSIISATVREFFSGSRGAY